MSRYFHFYLFKIYYLPLYTRSYTDSFSNCNKLDSEKYTIYCHYTLKFFEVKLVPVKQSTVEQFKYIPNIQIKSNTQLCLITVPKRLDCKNVLPNYKC